MNQNDPYAKLGGGALDQELFKTKQTPPPSRNRNSSAKETSNLKTQVTPPSRQDRENKESKSISTDVVKSSLHDVNLRVWRDTIENTQTRGSSLRLTNNEIYAVEDVLKNLERLLKVKTSVNELARLGLLFLIQDFKKHGEKSLIYRVKKS